MKIKTELPVAIEVSDYHEFNKIREIISLINPSIKIKEIDCEDGYVGVMYIGKITSKANKTFFEKVENGEICPN